MALARVKHNLKHMKKLTFFVLLFWGGIQLLIAQLVIVPTSSFRETESLFRNPDFTVHFYRDEFVIATAKGDLPKQNYVVLDENPWENDVSYYIVYVDGNVDKAAWRSQNEKQAEVLYDGEWFMIVSSCETLHGPLQPAKNDGMVKVFERGAALPKNRINTPNKNLEPDAWVEDLLDEIEGDSITSWVQHLENYGTRDAYSPESVQAQQWIAEKFLSWGLDVEIMDFDMSGGPASDNIIATLTGTKYPDEYVVLGGHSDSYSSSAMAPGADDNASGTAGVMEIARILSQYEFDRSIVFCAFSGEEYGLHGSAAYASRSAQQGMEILGYFNMDMIGYLEPGNTTIMTSLIYPQSAKELADFYTDVAAVYLPDFMITTSTMIGGDSDHTSFNNNGYMGIFPFEDSENYSPYIHTANDLVGPSYNNQEQAVVFSKATMASVVTLSDLLTPPRNLLAIPGDGMVELHWDEMYDVDYFNIYRDGIFLSSSANSMFTDTEVENGVQYEYYVTAVYSDSEEESAPSNRVWVTPMPPISFPLFIDFENGFPYWELSPQWGLTSNESFSPSYSLSESPDGAYENDREDYATLFPVNLEGYTDATLSFYTRYDIENNYDFMYLQISSDGNNWNTLDTYSGTQSQWTEKVYSLNDYLDEPYVAIRFYFSSDYTVTKDGMYIDDFSLVTEGGYETQTLELPSGWSGVSSYLVPAQDQMADLLQPLTGEMELIQDMTYTWWPSENVNTLTTWDSQSGYKIKVHDNTSLEIQGDWPENNTISIDEGWNLIPVASECPVDISVLLDDSEVIMVKEVGGEGVYWPSQNVFSLNQLLPGKAYMLKASEDSEITFPECEMNLLTNLHQPQQGPWERVSPTASSHVIALPYFPENSFQEGDFVGVFTSDGLCAGYTQIAEPAANQALMVYADDITTPEIDGFSEGESMNFRLFSVEEQKEYELVADFNNGFPQEDQFQSEGISGLLSLELATSVFHFAENTFLLYPNPAEELLKIETGKTSQWTLDIYSMDGQHLFSKVMTGDAEIDLTAFSAGVYFFKTEGLDRIEVHKVVIQ